MRASHIIFMILAASRDSIFTERSSPQVLIGEGVYAPVPTSMSSADRAAAGRPGGRKPAPKKTPFAGPFF